MGEAFSGIGDIFSNIPIIGDLLFSDTSAKKAQEAAAKSSADAAAKEEARNSQFMASQQAQRDTIAAQQKADTEATQASLDKAKLDAAKQAAALASTGGNLAPGAAATAGLPGFDQLKKRQLQNAPKLQQSNVLNPPPTISQAAGINPAAGGRRYI